MEIVLLESCLRNGATSEWPTILPRVNAMAGNQYPDEGIRAFMSIGKRFG